MGFFCLGPSIDQVKNFQVTMRTATEVHLSWDPPEKHTVQLYQVKIIAILIHTE